MDKDDPSGSTEQFSHQHGTRKRERSNEPVLSWVSESTAGCKAECVLITRIRATDIAISLRRIPVGFYVAVKSENVTKQTSNKLALVGKDVVEWDDEILLPSDRSSRVSLTVFAPLELGPRLGNGEVVDEFETTVGELLDRNGQLEHVRFLEQSDGEVVSLRSSLEIEIEERVYDQSAYAAASNQSESEEMRQLGELTERGHHALIRYRELQEQQDFNMAVMHFEHVRDMLPLDHPSRATVLFNLATAKLMHCRVNDGLPDLDMSIYLYRDALRLRPLGHPDHPTTLLSLGVALEARFQRKNDEVDETGGRTLLSQVLDVAPADSYVYHAAFLALGSSAKAELIRSTGDPRTIAHGTDDEGDDVDDEETVHRLDAALQWIFYPDSCRSAMLDPLGILFCIRFDRLADLADSEKGISILEFLVQSASDNHPDMSLWMDHLGNLLSTRYERSRDRTDLEKSISMSEGAVQFTPDGHPEMPSLLNNLGSSLLTRYEHFGDDGDLQTSVSLGEDAVRLTPDGHPDKSSWLNNLVGSLLARYERFADVADLERSILILKDLVQLTPDDDPEKPGRLSNFGNSLLNRYGCLRDDGDLEESIAMFESAVKLTADGDSEHASRLNNLGDSLLTRYERFGQIGDLKRSISLFEDAVRFTPDGHADGPAWLNNLGGALLIHYRYSGDVDNLERSISARGHGVHSTPDGHPDKPAWLNNLGESLLARYQRFGYDVDLEKSTAMFEDAVRLTPDDHPDKPLRLDNLGGLLLTRYRRFGDVADLKRSILVKEEAVLLAPEGHAQKPGWLNNLGGALLARYQCFGDVADLQQSILLGEEVLRLTPDGHPDKPAWLNNLGDMLVIRYEHFGDIADLEKSISTKKDAVRLTPDDHVNKSAWLNNLGDSLVTRFTRSEDDADLEGSISVFKLAVKLTPDGHPDKPLRLNNLGGSLLVRYHRHKDVADLQESISIREEVVKLTPNGHSDRPAWLNNLGGSLLVRYQHFKNIEDLERSILMGEDAVQSTPDGHPEKPRLLVSLSRSLLERFKRSGDTSSPDLSKAISHTSQAALSRTGLSLDRLHAAQLWILCAHLLRDDSKSPLDAYKVAIDLLPQLAWIGLSLHDRYHQLLRATEEACDAAAAALEANRPELAVEWLEQGRSIMWTQLSQLRTPVDDLRAASPELAAEFERVSRMLEHANPQDQTKVNGFTNPSHTSTMDRSPEKQAEQHHALAHLREKLLADIRALPGFERFLLPKTINQLCPLAHLGPVVFLNASEYRCDALVVKAGSDHVIYVPLSKIDYHELAGMQKRLNKSLRLQGRTIPHDDANRAGRPEGLAPEEVFGSMLPSLWQKVVSPILEVLGLSTRGPSLSRIFWCPTGPFTFLPIHAAGIYDKTNPGPKLSDFVISSYVPTMSALQMPSMEHSASGSIRLLAVRQSSTDGQTHLTGVQEEMEVIRNLTSLTPFVGVQETDGTVEDVMAKMKETDWVHFACHGIQDRAHPFDSGFPLAHRKRLKLSDITKLSRPQGGLAFLSACQTATGDEQLSEEAIHIAAGMLLAGYRSVIATMWSIGDYDAPRVAKDVYNNLFEDGKVPDSNKAAEALHHAIERLRDSGSPFFSWVPFAHVGS